jgi:hypothetical protein
MRVMALVDSSSSACCVCAVTLGRGGYEDEVAQWRVLERD